MTEFINAVMPGARYWQEQRQAEKMLIVEARQAGSGPDPLDLDAGLMVLRDRTGQATETSTDIGNPHRTRVPKPADDQQTTAADDITRTPPATEDQA